MDSNIEFEKVWKELCIAHTADVDKYRDLGRLVYKKLVKEKINQYTDTQRLETRLVATIKKIILDGHHQYMPKLHEISCVFNSVYIPHNWKMDIHRCEHCYFQMFVKGRMMKCMYKISKRLAAKEEIHVFGDKKDEFFSCEDFVHKLDQEGIDNYSSQFPPLRFTEEYRNKHGSISERVNKIANNKKIGG